MKRYIILSILVIIPLFAMCQVQPKIGGARADSLSFKSDDWTLWVKSLSNDTTLTDTDSSAIPTEYAVKKYVDSSVPSGIGSLQDSIDAHTDTLQLHNTRINTNLTSIESKQDSIDIHTDTLQLHNTRINTNAAGLVSLQDSIDLHTDTLQSHNTRIIALEGGSGTGDVTVTGTPADGYVAVWTSSSAIEGTSDFQFTGSTRTSGAFYTGTTDPNSTNRMNFGGNLHAYKLTSITDINSSVLNTSGTTSTAGYFDNGTTNPSSTTRLNYNGSLYSTNIYLSSDIRSSVLNTSGTTKTSGYFYTGTTAPTNTTRLNYDGTLWGTAFSSTGFSTTAAGGVYAADTSRFVGNMVIDDSLDVGDELHVADTLVLGYLSGGDDLFWLVGTGYRGGIDSGSLAAAAFALKLNLKTAQERLKDQKKGEVEWFYTDKDGNVKSTFVPTSLNPMEYLQALQAAIELNLRNIAAVERKQEELEKRIDKLEKKTKRRE
jgi:hypothetical protein